MRLRAGAEIEMQHRVYVAAIAGGPPKRSVSEIMVRFERLAKRQVKRIERLLRAAQNPTARANLRLLRDAWSACEIASIDEEGHVCDVQQLARALLAKRATRTGKTPRKRPKVVRRDR